MVENEQARQSRALHVSTKCLQFYPLGLGKSLKLTKFESEMIRSVCPKGILMGDEL